MKKLSYLVLFFLLAIPASAQNQFKLSSIPFLLSWHNMSKSFQMTDINKRISTIPHNLIIHNHPVDYEIEKESFQQPFREVEGCKRSAYPV